VCCESSVVDPETLANNDLDGDSTKRTPPLCSQLAATNSEINDATGSRSVTAMQGTRKFGNLKCFLKEQLRGSFKSILTTMSR